MSYFSAGDWTVKDGHDDRAFMEAWLASVEMDPPIEGLKVPPRLLKDLDRPGHYFSFAEWESRDAINSFRSRPDFPEVMGRIKEHADFKIYTLEQVQ
jgi:heme-degrading monooxygenase HmoA